jgi:rhodanese-related sulfurtransferase
MLCIFLLQSSSSELTELAKHKGKPIVVVCKHGQQAGESVKKLEAAGHDPVLN